MQFYKKRVYMDFASATPIHKEVKKELVRGLSLFGNPSAPHKEGRDAHKAVEEARSRIAGILRAKKEDLYFTGSGTEGNNLAIFGVIEALLQKGAKPEDLHVVTSEIEHPSLGDPVSSLKRRGVSVSFAKPNKEGVITPEEILKYVREETVLVSIVAVQSEIGVIQPLREIRGALNKFREKREQKVQPLFEETSFPLLHSDASATPLYLDLAPERLGVDIATYDGQKIMGPKGVGVLYKDSSVTLDPLMRGGKQERGLRPGTENTPAIIGLAKAFELSEVGREERVKKVEEVRDYFISRIQNEFPNVSVNGSLKKRIANNVNISVPGADGDYLAVLMDKEGVSVSPRSACIASGTVSHTVEALGKGEEEAKGTLRFSLPPWVSKKDVDQAVNALKTSLRIIEPN